MKILTAFVPMYRIFCMSVFHRYIFPSPGVRFVPEVYFAQKHPVNLDNTYIFRFKKPYSQMKTGYENIKFTLK